MQRKIPVLPAENKQIPIIIDTDAANEIDDIYAIALALKAHERFDIKGFIATHYAQKGNRDTIKESYDIINELTKVAECDVRIEMGGHPMCYPNVPCDSDGARFIIECARKASIDNPLYVLGLGAASNLASALLIEPAIAEKVVYMFHGRSEDTWPVRSTQFNIYGDIIAAKTILESNVPFIWFDTGTRLNASMSETEQKLKPLGALGNYLHEYRYRCEYFQWDNKGFFDIGDIAWLMDYSLCKYEIIDAPTLTRWMYFDFNKTHGKIIYVSEIDAKRTWDLFYKTLKRDNKSNCTIKLGRN